VRGGSDIAAPGILEPDAAQGAERASFDAFVSYRRITVDTEFVDQLQRDLADRGKRVWVDRAEIEPASDWSQRVKRGIDASKAFLYVLTPESAVSPECLHELEAAVERHKLIVPIVLRGVDRKILPEALTRPNWIYFSPGHDLGRGLDELTQALEEDLGWRDEHTRLGARTKEWEDSERDKSFLLRGSDLRTAEEWLGTAAAHPRTPPTAGQAAFIVASRKAAVRAQRTWRLALTAGLAISLALAAVALVQRNQARDEARLADSRALAAEATADLSSNPQQSLRLALNATTINAGGSAQQALRLAVADDRQRMVIQSGAGPATAAAWNPAMNQVAVTGPRDTVELWNTVTGRVTRVLDAAHASSGSDAVSGLLYDADGTRLAAVTSHASVSIWDISSGGAATPVPAGQLNSLVQGSLLRGMGGSFMQASGAWGGADGADFFVSSSSLSNVFVYEPQTGTAFALFQPALTYTDTLSKVVPSPDGSELLAGAQIIDFTTHTQIPLTPSASAVSNGYACWFPDGSAVVTATGIQAGGPEQIYSASTGALQSASMETPVGPVGAVACSSSPSDMWVTAGDASGNVILRLADGKVVPLYGHSDGINAIASSRDGRFLATASQDGTARIWDASSGKQVTVLQGDGAPLTAVQFGPGDGLVLTVDARGFVRVWDTGVGEPLTVLQAPARGQAVALGFATSRQEVYGVDLTTSSGASAQVTSVTALSWDARSGRLLRSTPLPGIAPVPVPCSAALASIHIAMGFATLAGGACKLPPPPPFTLAIPVPRPQPTAPYYSETELFAVATSLDGRYVAYPRSDSVILLDSGGGTAATLQLRGPPTGLAFGPGPDDLTIMTPTAIYLWEPFSGHRALVIPQPSAPIDVAFSTSGNVLAAADTAGTVGVWNAATGGVLRTFRLTGKYSPYYPPLPLRVALSMDGNVVAAGTADGAVYQWGVATGRRLSVTTLAIWPIVELSPTAGGASLLAVDMPQAGSGVDASGTAALLSFGTGQTIAAYQSPAPLYAPVDPGAALSPDGSALYSGALGLSPSPPGGTLAVYQVSGGQPVAGLQAAAGSPVEDYSEFPVQPWSPDGADLLAGNSIYRCDACQALTQLQQVAVSRIAWSAPLSATSDHPPSTDPYD
jgi:WD40 repeat protein